MFGKIAVQLFTCQKGDMQSEPILIDQTPTLAEIVRFADTGRPVILRTCHLAGLDLAQLDLSGWQFERCNLNQTKFNGALMEGTTFTACRAAGASFLGASMIDTTINGGDFSNSNFRGASLSSTRFVNCKMTGTDMTEARTLEVGFDDVLLIMAVMPGFSFRKTTLRRVDLTEADLRRCDFRNVVFEDCSLRDAHLVDCSFDDADLRGADLGGIKLTDARRFKGAVISKRQAADFLGQLGLKVL